MFILRRWEVFFLKCTFSSCLICIYTYIKYLKIYILDIVIIICIITLCFKIVICFRDYERIHTDGRNVDNHKAEMLIICNTTVGRSLCSWVPRWPPHQPWLPVLTASCGPPAGTWAGPVTHFRQIRYCGSDAAGLPKLSPGVAYSPLGLLKHLFLARSLLESSCHAGQSQTPGECPCESAPVDSPASALCQQPVATASCVSNRERPVWPMLLAHGSLCCCFYHPHKRDTWENHPVSIVDP